MQNYQLVQEIASLLVKSNNGHGEVDLTCVGLLVQLGFMYGKFEDGVWNVWNAWQGIEKFTSPKDAAKRMYEATR